MYSGNVHTMELPIEEEEYQQGMKMYQEGFLLKSIFPLLSDDQREFMVTGMTREEWEELA